MSKTPIRCTLTDRLGHCTFKLEGRDWWLIWMLDDEQEIMLEYRHVVPVEDEYKFPLYKASKEVGLDWIDGGTPNTKQTGS